MFLLNPKINTSKCAKDKVNPKVYPKKKKKTNQLFHEYKPELTKNLIISLSIQFKFDLVFTRSDHNSEYWCGAK